MKKLISLIFLFLTLTACGSEQDEPMAELPSYTDTQFIALLGDESGVIDSSVTIGDEGFKNCSLMVSSDDLADLNMIDGHEFKPVSVSGSECAWYMNVESQLTRTVKICQDHAEISITCHDKN
ncbi:MAG: hypothetical protein EOP04_19435 [Proteobacteria bacterium]|nr:MAG: hypothetical protein EOP04_19435 [Pseudomonadota bacterium]